MTLRTLLFSAAIAFAAPAAHANPDAPSGVKITNPGGATTSTSVVLGLDKSTVIELETAAADVVITNPNIADAVVQTPKRIIFRGVDIGQTNAIIFDASGRQLVNLDLNVEVDTAALEAIIAKNIPAARINIESANGRMILSGRVDDFTQQDKILELMSAYAPNGEDTIVNLLQVAAKEQVMLRVRIVEMQRGVTKQLGINLGAASVTEDLAAAIGSTLGFNATGGSNGGLVGDFSTVLSRSANGAPHNTLSGAFAALERIGLSRTLAEPNIVALSGETGEFLAGGEFPIPVAGDDDGLTVEFKQFGVSLGFTPVVLSEGRISLQVAAEVSELSSQGAVTTGGVTIPGLTTRRVSSTVEIPSGGSMMMAGLIQSSTITGMDQLPGINKVPILSALFQSRDFVNSESELVVIVTPYLVDPSRPSELSTPDAGFTLSTDLDAFLFGKLNHVYGRGGEPIDPAAYRAPVGYIEE
ncbi:MAG: type II and III secretion system protein family protein [Pseudomonadota bacterium]